jgi:hypothetical protein
VWIQQDAPRFVKAAMNNGVQAEGLKTYDHPKLSEGIASYQPL